jgi:hypothetical protein
MTNEEILIEYPIQDDIWPSRRWKADGSDYCDLSRNEEQLTCPHFVGNVCTCSKEEQEKCIVKLPHL